LSRPVPTAIPGLNGVVELTSGRHHVCARTSTSIYCWGWNQDGALGDQSRVDSYIPKKVADVGLGVRSIAAGAVHTCAALSDDVVCWGANRSYQLGNGTRTDSLEAVPVEGLPREPLRIDARERHTCAVAESGRVYCWGDNANGELGDGTTGTRTGAVAVLPF